MEVITKSAAETQSLGQKIGLDLKPGCLLALYGELGSGKTTFIQGLAKGLGIKKRILSPTFVFIRPYPLSSKGTFYHVDLYRINKVSEAAGLGLEEIFADPEAITVIEWAERIKPILPQKRTEIFFEYLGDNQRRIKIK
ncbi:MAG: tRNA (adenosine(37)-N6)-threonylcarbamoyltransferase complex ATPase subunit type 1 TsaE [Candidatus Marinimicrobia bacterium]|nr:tRNA (adenosine(37)-N6)-threonylcarbamoyltransferase complex ATPase subunit type 1 TsaE [Candidatus Neomarinimicrobiota bacterium]